MKRLTDTEVHNTAICIGIIYRVASLIGTTVKNNRPLDETTDAIKDYVKTELSKLK